MPRFPFDRPVTFAQFMEWALYDPAAGFYSRRRQGGYPVGPGGAFVTAPTAHPAFAATMARIFAVLAKALGEALTLVDVGAADGQFLARLVGELPTELVQRVVAVERSPFGRQRICERLPQIEVWPAVSDAKKPQGACLLFASELYDAFPFSLLEAGEDGQLRELYVRAEKTGRLVLWPGETSTPALGEYLKKHGLNLQPGQRVEVRLSVRGFHEELLRWAGDNALCMVVDYGYPAAKLYNPKLRRAGTAVAYRGQRLESDVLAEPGEVDITAHVNWDDLLAAGNDLGFGARPVEPLGLFLTRWGILELAGAGGKESPLPWEVRVLVHPAGMGSDLKVLVQGKGTLWECWQELDGQKRP